MVAVSPQIAKYSRQVAKKHNLAFPLLSDAGNRVASQFGLVYSLPDDLRALYLNFGIDLERFNGEGSWTLPIPGRFILDQKGTIIWADAHPDYTIRSDPGEIKERLKTLR